jgi:hypothetical protein
MSDRKEYYELKLNEAIEALSKIPEPKTSEEIYLAHLDIQYWRGYLNELEEKKEG